MKFPYKRLAAGSPSPTYDPITFDMSVKTSITCTHSNSHTHLEWLTLWLHSPIPPTQLLEIWHFKQLEGPSSIIQSQSCNRTRSDCDDLAENIISSGHGACLLFTSCHPPNGQAIDTLLIFLSVSIFYDLALWLNSFMCKSCNHCFSAGFVKDAAKLVWHRRQWCLFDLQVSEYRAQGDRCGVHGYNVNVLSPWRRSIALSQRGTDTSWHLFMLEEGGKDRPKFVIRARQQ